MAEPSRRNSGQETTQNGMGLGWLRRMMSATQSPVPTGTVDLLTTISGATIALAIGFRRRTDILQVRLAIDAGGRADGDEDELRLGQRLGIGGGEGQPPRGHIPATISSRPGS